MKYSDNTEDGNQTLLLKGKTPHCVVLRVNIRYNIGKLHSNFKCLLVVSLLLFCRGHRIEQTCMNDVAIG